MAKIMTTVEILRMYGITTLTSAEVIRYDMLTDPEGIGHLGDEDTEGIQLVCAGYIKRTVANRRFIINRVQQKILISPRHWEKDEQTSGKLTEFEDTYTQDELSKEIEAGTEQS